MSCLAARVPICPMMVVMSDVPKFLAFWHKESQ